MGRAQFDNARFLGAARDIAHEIGPAGVTVGSVTQRLGAPTGSFYYRFPSRDLLLGELWLATALAFQEDFVAAIETGHGIAAALHTPVWVRAHLDAMAEYLDQYPRAGFIAMHEGSWGAEGTNQVWMNPETSWTYTHIYPA